MILDKPTRLFLIYALIVVSILLFISCSFDDNEITGGSNSIHSTYYIESSQTSVPMDFSLKEGESVYFELPDISVEFYTVYEHYPIGGNNQAIIIISYNHQSNAQEIGYNSSDGQKSFQAKNGTNYVVQLKEILKRNNYFELEMSINQYGRL